VGKKVVGKQRYSMNRLRSMHRREGIALKQLHCETVTDLNASMKTKNLTVINGISEKSIAELQ
jgi:hypothetical protein